MNFPRQVTAAARIVAVLALLAGVFAMHTLTTGRHGDHPLTGGHVPAAVGTAEARHHDPSGPLRPMRQVDLPSLHSALAGATVDIGPWATACGQDCLHDESGGASHLSGHVLGMCLAILLAAATTLLLRALAFRAVLAWPAVSASAALVTAARVRRPNPPCLFTLGVLRT